MRDKSNKIFLKEHIQTMLDILALEHRSTSDFYKILTSYDTDLFSKNIERLRSKYRKELIGEGYWKILYIKTNNDNITSFFLSHCEIPVIVYTSTGKICNDAAVVLFDYHVIKQPLIVTILNDKFSKVVSLEETLALPNDSFLIKNAFLYDRDIEKFFSDIDPFFMDNIRKEDELQWYLRYYVSKFSLEYKDFESSYNNWKKLISRFHNVFIKYKRSDKFMALAAESQDDFYTNFVNHKGLLNFSDMRVSIVE